MRRYIELLEDKHKKKEKNPKEIVFIAEYIKPRIFKIAYALKKNNYRVVLCLKKGKNNNLKNLDYSFFDKVYFFKHEKDLYKKCLSYSPIVYHIFSEALVGEWSAYIIKRKKNLGKIIYDQYDIYRGFVTNSFDNIAKREKFCLENADGLCCRMFETQYLKKAYQYNFQRRLLFLDYCWNSKNFIPNKEGNKRIKIVYGGRLLSRNNENIDRYKVELNGFKYIARTLDEKKGYFIIIPLSSCKGSVYNEYRNIKRKHSNVVIKEPMSFDQLIKYESQLDYGIDCVELEEDLKELCNNKNDYKLRLKNKYYATNKYFDYLDAGIMPIYGRKNELFGYYLERYNGAIKCTLEELPNKIDDLKKSRKVNSEKAIQARNFFAIENQIQRLIEFYKSI